jgi:methyl-accepting chemotaxis protein
VESEKFQKENSMSFFKNITLFWKFSIFGGLVSLLLALLLGITYNGLRGTDKQFTEYTERHQGIGRRLYSINAQGLQAEQAIRNIVLNPSDDKAFDNYKKANAELISLNNEAAQLAKGIPDLAEGLDKLQDAWKNHTAVQMEVIELARGGNPAAAATFLNTKETASWRGVKDGIHGLQQRSAANLKKQRAALNSFTKTNFTYTVTALVGTLIIANLLLLVFWRIISTPMSDLIFRLRDIAAGGGDLTKRLEVRGKDEFAEAARLLNDFIGKLNHTLSAVIGTTSTLASTTFQLNSTAEQMATSAEEVSAQATTVATASEEMAATSNDIAQNCYSAAQSAQHAADTTQKGFDVVKHTVDGILHRGEATKETAQAISSLGERSDQIGVIVATIEDIADQTNLLALNAAIEAARAGEMGRGFAVVADEVRALAERTTRATKEISDMIRAIQSETRQAIVRMDEGVRGTEKGAAEAAELESALSEILEQVNAVTMQVSQIATAAEEQTATTSEITGNIHKISEVIEGTAKGAQDTSAAAASLAESSEELRRLMGQFKLS